MRLTYSIPRAERSQSDHRSAQGRSVPPVGARQAVSRSPHRWGANNETRESFLPCGKPLERIYADFSKPADCAFIPTSPNGPPPCTQAEPPTRSLHCPHPKSGSSNSRVPSAPVGLATASKEGVCQLQGAPHSGWQLVACPGLRGVHSWRTSTRCGLQVLHPDALVGPAGCRTACLCSRE